MNSRDLEKLVSRYEEQESLSGKQCAELADLLRMNSKLAGQMVDDRAVNGMLALIASGKIG